MENHDTVEERRRYKRIDSALSVRFRNLRNNENPILESLSKNVSEGGVCFNSNQFISLACRMILEITLPTNPKPIRAISKVAWIRKLPAGDNYQVGNQFLEITKEDKQHISQFINQVLSINT